MQSSNQPRRAWLHSAWEGNNKSRTFFSFLLPFFALIRHVRSETDKRLIKEIIRRKHCSHWTWAVTGATSHYENTHAWQMTKICDAMTSSTLVRVRQHYLSGRESLQRPGSRRPPEWGRTNCWGGGRPFDVRLWHEDMSLERTGWGSNVLSIFSLQT